MFIHHAIKDMSALGGMVDKVDTMPPIPRAMKLNEMARDFGINDGRAIYEYLNACRMASRHLVQGVRTIGFNN